MNLKCSKKNEDAELDDLSEQKTTGTMIGEKFIFQVFLLQI